MDIKSFFTSIDQRILYNLVAKKVKNEEILWLARVIIFHDSARDIRPKVQSPPSLFDRLPNEKTLFKVARGKGLPIGNLTSQFFANVYMNELDHFAKHKLKAKRYVRYVDDFLILDKDKSKLEFDKKMIEKFLQNNLLLKLHPLKQKIRPVGDGIDFVGYMIRPEYVLVRRRVVWQWRQARRDCRASLEITNVNNSYLAHAKWANSWNLQRKLNAVS